MTCIDLRAKPVTDALPFILDFKKQKIDSNVIVE